MRNPRLRNVVLVGLVVAAVAAQVAVLAALAAHARADDDAKATSAKATNVACLKQGADVKFCLTDRGGTAGQHKYTVSCVGRVIRPGHDDAWSPCVDMDACTGEKAHGLLTGCENPDACVSQDAHGWWRWCDGVEQGIPASCQWEWRGRAVCAQIIPRDPAKPRGTRKRTRP